MKYPLYREARDQIMLPSGRPVEEFSVESLEAGRLGTEDLGIHRETLRAQAAIAEEAGERFVVRGLETLTDGTRVRVSGS